MRHLYFHKTKNKGKCWQKRQSITHQIGMLVFILIATLGIIFGGGITARAKDPFPNQVVVNPPEQTSDDTLLSYRKSIGQTDTDAFTITLDVVTSQSIQSIGGKSASVVLVLDNSGSMSFGGGTTPGQYAREAMKEFANQYFQSNTQNQLGLVSYSSFGEPTIDAYDEIKYVTKSNSLTNDESVFTRAIDGLEAPKGETDVQMGIKVARDILDADTSGNPKFIVLFSDGAANKSARPLTAEPLGENTIIPFTHNGTKHDANFKFTSFDYSNYGNSVTTIPPYTTNGTAGLSAISEAFMARDTGIDIYSIFYHNPSLSDHEYGEGVFIMKNTASSGQYTEIAPGNAADFADIFSEIEKKIEEAVAPWNIIDPMADFIHFIGFTGTAPSGAEFDPSTSTLNWNLREVEGIEDESGNFHYSLSYNITLESENESFTNGKAYPANNTTTLTYQKMVNLYNAEECRAEFTVPQIKRDSISTSALHVKALDTIAYQDGSSASGDTFPRPYLAFFWDNSGQPGAQLTQSELDGLSFTIDSELFKEGDHTFFIYEYPFRTQYVNETTGAVHNDPAALDESPGMYNIHFTAQDYDTGHIYTIAASDILGNTYDFRFDQTGRLEVREQSPVPTQYTPYQTGTPTADFGGKTPTSFLAEDTQLYNTAGSKLNDIVAAKVTLLADGVLPQEQQGIASVLDQRSDMIGKSYVISYLQLVDNEDGNIVVEADKDVSVFYPYPPDTKSTTDFIVLHFSETNRSVGLDPVYTASSPLNTTKMDNGLMFTTSGKMEGFGPFVIAFPDPYANTGVELPSAGGAGINKYILTGFFMITGSALIILIAKRKKIGEKNKKSE